MILLRPVDESSPPAPTALGDLVGLGRTAEVFARGEDEVVKLLRPGIPDHLGEREARVAALVEEAAVAAPRLLGTMQIDGRYGLVYERLVGPSMMDDVARRPWEIDRSARRFAAVHAAMHDASGIGLPAQRARMRRMIERADTVLPDGARKAALARLDSLPDGDAICHGDMHPGNVLVTGRGAVVIEWETSSCGSAAGDVARTLLLLRHSGIPEHLPRVQRSLIRLARRRFSAVYVREYRKLRGLDEREVVAWRLPVLAARLGERIEVERAAVQALIRRELGRSGPYA